MFTCEFCEIFKEGFLYNISKTASKIVEKRIIF